LFYGHLAVFAWLHFSDSSIVQQSSRIKMAESSKDSFQFKELDVEGLHTLEAVSEAVHFNRWMFEQVLPSMQHKVLEVGSGIGNISEFFIQVGVDITLSDIRDNYCDALKKKFPGRNVLKMDLVDPQFEQKYAALAGTFDGVFALNVVEHIEADLLALKNIGYLLKPGGKVLILVPAGPLLYNKIDKGLYHFRRYTRRSLLRVLSGAGFRVEKSWMFNAMGIPAWVAGGLVFRSNELKKGQMNAYDKLIPLARLLDAFTFKKVGLSVIAVGVR
jgi:2-polyprenyl-3-methyl-5-hydroxy-6-metoxy-1,4-benzoquinol methylase